MGSYVAQGNTAEQIQCDAVFKEIDARYGMIVSIVLAP